MSASRNRPVKLALQALKKCNGLSLHEYIAIEEAILKRRRVFWQWFDLIPGSRPHRCRGAIGMMIAELREATFRWEEDQDCEPLDEELFGDTSDMTPLVVDLLDSEGNLLESLGCIWTYSWSLDHKLKTDYEADLAIEAFT